MMQETELTLWLESEKRGEKAYFPAWSARGCQQILAFVHAPVLKRTVNGVLMDVGHPSQRKYRTVICCEDREAPAFETFWQGVHLRVDCIQEFKVPLSPAQREVMLGRPPVPGSCFAETLSGEPVQVSKVDDKKAYLGKIDDKGYLSYRPCLSMLLVSYQLKTDEWGMTVGWEMVLEEV